MFQIFQTRSRATVVYCRFPKNIRVSAMSNNGRKHIQLRIPKTEEEFKEELLPCICKICDKGFSSGKALGGHMRIHARANKKLLGKKIENPSLKKQYYHGATSDLSSVVNMETTEFSCYLCCHNFPTIKSLCGHMRTHPERPWKGIRPPPALKTTNSSSSTLSNAVSQKFDEHTDFADTTTEAAGADLSSSLPGWSVTSKRGHKGISSTSSSCEATNSNSLTKKVETKVPPLGLARGFTEGGSCSNGILQKKADRGKEKALLETGFTPEKPVNLKREWDNDNDNDNGRSFLMKKKKQRTMKLVDLEFEAEAVRDDAINPVTPNRYICSICSKSFPTHQALGGHRSSHNKSKNIIHSSDQSASADEHYANQVYETKPVAGVAASRHQCKICNKSFPTGQALGGHKRCHWTNNPVEFQSSTDQVALPAEAKGQTSTTDQVESAGETSQTNRRILDFDLNELPAMEDGGEGLV